MFQLQLWSNEQETENQGKIWNQIDCSEQNRLMELLAQVICKAAQTPNNLIELEEEHESER